MKSSRCPEIKLHPDEDLDCFLEGRLKLIQSRDGYRFSIDAVFLSEFVTIRPEDVVLDLGTGCGIIPLLLLTTRPLSRVFGLEIQRELADQAMRNVSLNGFEDRMKVILGDIKHPPIQKNRVDVVICNPPYRKKDSGRLNPDMRRAIARHELLASVDDILRTARNLLRKRGRIAMVYPADRMVDLVARMRRCNLEPKRIQFNYPGYESGAKLVLIEAWLGARPGAKILPPLMGQGNFPVNS